MTFTLDAANALIAPDLTAMHAATATDLVPGASPRALVVAELFSPPLSNSSPNVVLGLAPGSPGHLLVPTAMEYLRYTISVAKDGSATITRAPTSRAVRRGRAELELHLRTVVRQPRLQSGDPE